MFKICKYKQHTGNTNVLLELMVKDKTRKDGYDDICKTCAYLRKKEYVRRINTGEIGLQSKNEFIRKQILKNNIRKIRDGFPAALFKSAKYRATAKNIEFSLTVEDIIIPRFCPILLIELETELLFHNKRGKIGINHLPPNYPSIDRIDSTKGYIKSNIQIISWRANHLKSDSTFYEIEKLYQWQKLQRCL